MEWYYAVGGEQKGPVSAQELERLAAQGVVTADTLVWRDGLANWQRFADSNLGTPAPPPAPIIVPPAAPPGGGVFCAGCGGVFQGTDVISLGGGLYCASCKPAALQRLREGESTSGAAEAIRNEHLKHEASVKSIGVLYYLGGVGLVLVGGISLLGAASGGMGQERVAAGFLAIVFLLLGIGQFWVGTGLRRLRSWARIPTGILSGIGLLGFPLGTIINGYILYLIFSRKGKVVFSEEYRTVIEQTPHIKYRTSIVVWVFLGLVIALILFGVVAAFLGARRSGG